MYKSSTKETFAVIINKLLQIILYQLLKQFTNWPNTTLVSQLIAQHLRVLTPKQLIRIASYILWATTSMEFWNFIHV